MNSIPGENRELDALVNQPKETHKGVTYLALTFGTLLSSQGADALVLQPFGLRSRRYLHCTPRSAAVGPRRSVRRFPRPCGPVRSRSVQREQYTTCGALCRGVRGGVCL